MEFLRKIINKVKNLRKSGGVSYQELTPEEKIRKCLQPYQRCLYKLQDIILWESPSQSLLTLLATNILFWLVSLHQFRFYCLLFSVALIYVTHEAWTQHVWPEISVRPTGKDSQTSDEEDDSQERLGEPQISHYVSSFCIAVSELISRMKSLRETQPLVYGGVMSSFFLTMVAVGRVMSGLCLLYILVMSVLILPGIFIHLLPPEYKEKMYNTYAVMHSLMNPSDSSVDVDEYLPETSRENMELFAEAVEFNTDTNGSSSDSVSGDLCLLGSSLAMPSHEETSMDAFDSLSLDPSAALRADTSSDDEASSSEFSLQFKPTHFNGKASTADDPTTVRQSASIISQSAGIIGQGADIIASAVASTVAQSLVGLAKPSRPPARADSSDDSEFEIIETDEVS